ncbi:MAG: hypothetical protein J6T34_02735 [Bacilli bacterium]|nr:hypothetical protein [Bacilli bacterium]
MEKEYIYMKSDTSENWSKAKNFIPGKNELIIYTDFIPTGMKIGDGKTKLEDLKFIDNNDFEVDGDTLIINTKGGY